MKKGRRKKEVNEIRRKGGEKEKGWKEEKRLVSIFWLGKNNKVNTQLIFSGNEGDIKFMSNIVSSWALPDWYHKMGIENSLWLRQ